MVNGFNSYSFYCYILRFLRSIDESDDLDELDKFVYSELTYTLSYFFVYIAYDFLLDKIKYFFISFVCI